MSAALACAAVSSAAPAAGLTVPVFPGLPAAPGRTATVPVVVTG